MSEIRTDTINNASGDNDSGIDLSTNDVVAIKTANTERVRITSDGKIGIGTSTPDGYLTINKNTGQADLPSIRLIDDSDSREVFITNQSGDLFMGTSNSSDDVVDSCFQITTNVIVAKTQNTERFRIMSDGRIGHGATSALSGAHFTQTIDSVNGPGFLLNSTDASGNTHNQVLFRRNGSDIGSIQTSGTSTAYNTSSDYRLKENVTADWDATTRLKQLNPVRFNFIADADTTVDGFLAHEVQSVVPEAISGTHNEVEVWKDGEELPDGVSVGDNKLDEDGNTIPVYQGIDQSKLVPLLVKTIQELEARITALENA